MKTLGEATRAHRDERELPNGPNNAELGLLFRQLAAVAAVVVALIALAVLFARAFGVERLMTVLPGFLLMKSTTAIGFLAAATAVLAEFMGSRVLVRRLAAIVPLAIGVGTLVAYVSGVSVHIDDLLFLDPVQAPYPSRMPHLTAFNLIILGLALLFRTKARTPNRPSAVLALVVTTLSLFAIVGYLYGVPLLYGPIQYSAMAIQTGISFLLLSLAVLFIDPAGAVARLLASENAGGIVTRRLLPMALVIPILLGGLVVRPAFNLGQLRMGMAFQTMLSVLLFAAIIVHLGHSLNVASRATQAAEQSMMLDGLTGIYNRRYFDRRLTDELGRSRRQGAPLSLVIFDADHFKNINDQNGHLAGDEVLKAIASLASMTLRRSDAICRYGGEEFALILPHTSIEEAEGIADRLRTVVCGFSAEATGIPVTVSLGATTSCLRDENASDLITRADQALYEAKASGRNCVRARRAARSETRPSTAIVPVGLATITGIR